MKLILHNGKIRVSENRFVSAVLSENGVIRKIGEDCEILKEKDGQTTVIDLEGRTATAGFNDSHMHFLNVGYCASQIDFGVSSSIEEAVQLAKKFVKCGSDERDWIQCFGWNEDLWEEKRFLNRYDLDRISANRPVIAVRVCSHVCVLNSKALELIGIDRNSPQPLKGAFEIDEKGEPTGVLCELLADVYEKMPSPSVPALENMILTAGKAAASCGLTSVQTDDFCCVPGKSIANIITAYTNLAERDELPVRVTEQCRLTDCNQFDKFIEGGFCVNWGNDLFKLGSLKTFCDGSLGARTAWLKEAYSDAPETKGICLYEDDDVLFSLVEKAHLHKMPAVIHCIGDAAIDQAVTVIEKVKEKYPQNLVRHGIIHAQIMDENLLRRIENAEIVTYIQPVFMEYDLHMAEDRVGKERLKDSYHYRKMYDRKIYMPFGTDSPVESFNPMRNVYCAVTRKDFSGIPESGWDSEKALKLEECMECYTVHSAYASGEEDKKGRILPGYFADITIFEKDIYTMEEDELKDVGIYMTIMNGKVRYQK